MEGSCHDRQSRSINTLSQPCRKTRLPDGLTLAAEIKVGRYSNKRR